MKIFPFPSSIDRNYFGAWLSGFTDGEGCFRLDTESGGSYKAQASFHIGLRSDDLRIVNMIQSYWQCGIVGTYKIKGRRTNQSRIQIRCISDLRNTVAPHFDQFPLLAKKREDFRIWREGVELIYQVTSRPMASLGIYGRLPRWLSKDKEELQKLRNTLLVQREYKDDDNAGHL